MRRWRPAGAPGRRPLAVAADESAVDETEAGGLRAGRARPTRPVDATARRARGSVAEGRARASVRGPRRRGGCPAGADDAVAAYLTTGDDDGVRATCDEMSDDGRDAATSGGDAGGDGGGDDDGGDDGGETTGGNGGDDGGEASGGSVATPQPLSGDDGRRRGERRRCGDAPGGGDDGQAAGAPLRKKRRRGAPRHRDQARRR